MEEHPVFTKPKDENTKIWRYLNFTKFVSLIDKKALYFSRSDKLGDPFEGSSSKANLKMRPQWYGEVYEKINQALPSALKQFRYHTFLNCWHMNEIESDAMWKIYIQNDKGIAIQSTYKQLVESFEEGKGIQVGTVRYVDYESEVIPENNAFWPYVHKRKSFIHERELRAIMQKYPDKGPSWDGEGPSGLYIPVNLDTLIEKVYVAPTSPEWFEELVTSICYKFKIDKEIISSNLSEKPVF